MPELVRASLRRRLDPRRHGVRRRGLPPYRPLAAGPVRLQHDADLRAGVRRPEDARHQGRRIRAGIGAHDHRDHASQPGRGEHQRRAWLLQRRHGLAGRHRRNAGVEPPPLRRQWRHGLDLRAGRDHGRARPLDLRRHRGADLHARHALRDGRSRPPEVRAERRYDDAHPPVLCAAHPDPHRAHLVDADDDDLRPDPAAADRRRLRQSRLVLQLRRDRGERGDRRGERRLGRRHLGRPDLDRLVDRRHRCRLLQRLQGQERGVRLHRPRAGWVAGLHRHLDRARHVGRAAAGQEPVRRRRQVSRLLDLSRGPAVVCPHQHQAADALFVGVGRLQQHEHLDAVEGQRRHHPHHRQPRGQRDPAPAQPQRPAGLDLGRRLEGVGRRPGRCDDAGQLCREAAELRGHRRYPADRHGEQRRLRHGVGQEGPRRRL